MPLPTGLALTQPVVGRLAMPNALGSDYEIQVYMIAARLAAFCVGVTLASEAKFGSGAGAALSPSVCSAPALHGAR
eukprot:gene35678-33134_t